MRTQWLMHHMSHWRCWRHVTFWHAVLYRQTNYNFSTPWWFKTVTFEITCVVSASWFFESYSIPYPIFCSHIYWYWVVILAAMIFSSMRRMYLCLNSNSTCTQAPFFLKTTIWSRNLHRSSFLPKNQSRTTKIPWMYMCVGTSEALVDFSAEVQRWLQ